MITSQTTLSFIRSILSHVKIASNMQNLCWERVWCKYFVVVGSINTSFLYCFVLFFIIYSSFDSILDHTRGHSEIVQQIWSMIKISTWLSNTMKKCIFRYSYVECSSKKCPSKENKNKKNISRKKKYKYKFLIAKKIS